MSRPAVCPNGHAMDDGYFNCPACGAYRESAAVRCGHVNGEGLRCGRTPHQSGSHSYVDPRPIIGPGSEPLQQLRASHFPGRGE